MDDATPQPKEFTPKQKAWIKAYVNEARGNASEAARLAGYADAQQSGWLNKTNVDIWAEVSRILQERTLSGEEVLDRLTQHANGTMKHFVYTKGDVVVLDLATQQAQQNLHLLKKIKTKRRIGGTDERPWEEIETEIELHDPQAALVHLGRFHKLFTTNLDVMSDGKPIKGYAVCVNPEEM